MMEVAEPLPGVAPSRLRLPLRGYLLYLAAAFLFALNGPVAKTLLLSGLEATRLLQLRVTTAFIIMLVVVAIANRPGLRLRRSELPLLLVAGMVGLSLTQLLYFLSIERLPIAVALLIEFAAPFVVAVWFRFGLGYPTRSTVWAALVAALIGLAIVAQVWDGFRLDPLGVAFAAGSALTFALYYVVTDMAIRRPGSRDPVSLTMWIMGAAALLWAVVAPWWTFPADAFSASIQVLGASGPTVPILALVGWMVVMGTIAPFSLIVLSMQQLRASQASVMGMTEPIFATGIAWLVLGEVLAPIQLVGAAVVLVSILVAERSRVPSEVAVPAEAAPAAGP